MLLGAQAAPAEEPPATAPDAAKAPSKLAWAPPSLTDPITVEINDLTPTHSLKLKQDRDYILKLPATPLKGGLSIWGGHNVVLIGGEITVPTTEQDPAFKGPSRGLYLQAQTGTMHVEGVLLSGDGLKEGFNLDERLGGTVVLQNVRVETVHGKFSANHADVIQTWAGPGELRIDRLTGLTDYQGFFLLPNQHFKGDAPRGFDLRHLNLRGSDKSAYLLWRQTNPPFPLSLREVWLQPNPRKVEPKVDRDQFLWPKPSTGDTSWQDAQIGAPPEGDFVPAGVAGTSYVSPGYEEAQAAS